VEWAWEGRYNVRHLFEVLEGHARPALFHVWNLPRTYGELVLVPVAAFFYRVARGPRDAPGRAVALWILIPYVVFSLAATKMPGYVLVAAPALFLVTAQFICALLSLVRNTRHDTTHTHTHTQSRRRAVAAMLLAVVMIALPLRILLDGLRVFRPYDRQPAWASELRHLGERLAGSRAVILGAPRPIETMFYTSQVAYPHVPDRDTVVALVDRGYRLIVCDTPSLPREQRGWPEAEYVPVQTVPDQR
jgi:4-amino-4-deoxy-L-arabinose transferase-like glycosyltransferase